MNKRRLVIFGVIVVFIIIICVGLYFAFFKKNNSAAVSDAYKNGATVITQSRDTGQILESNPNLGPDIANGTNVTVLGLDQIINAGILEAQVNFIKTSLITYATTTLKDKYTNITIMPENLVYSNNVFTSTLRLGQTNTTLPITITANFTTGDTEVVVSDPTGKNGGNYDSGLVNLGEDN